MAEISFYINDKERTELIEFILSKGTEVVPDILYPTKRYKVISSVEHYISAMEKDMCKYFLLDDNYTFEPLDFLEIDFESGNQYKISQRIGGPYIDLSFYLGYSDDATIPYKRSWLDHYARFIHYKSYEEFKAPEELKAYYKEIVKFIKGKCKSVKKNGRTYWVSKEVLKEIGWE